MEYKNNQNADYGELVEFIAEKFDHLEGEIKEVKNGLSEVRGGLAEVKITLDTKADKADVDRILTRVTMLGDKIGDYRAEQLATQKQADAHEKWIAKASEKISVK